MDSHVKHKGKRQHWGQGGGDRTEKELEVTEREEGEKTANWQVRRRTTLLDWTGLDWRVTNSRLERWNEKEKSGVQG